MSQASDLPGDIEDELRAKSLSHFLLREESSKDCIVIEVYLNESWHPILQNWGSVVGVHLNAVLDRRPLTDETGNRVFSGSLADAKPITEYKWSGEWTPQVQDNSTDEDGYQYATGWGLMLDAFHPSPSMGKLMCVRRRRLTRRMIIDPNPPSKAMPYEVTITVKRGSLTGGVATSHTHVEVFLGSSFLDRTITSAPDWNKKIIKRLMQIDPDLMLTFAVYTKKTFNIPKPFPFTQAPTSEVVFRGSCQVILKDFLQNLAVVQHQEELHLVSAKGERVGSLVVKLELAETKLFSIEPTQSLAMGELQKVVEGALPFNIRYDIATIDNDNNTLLQVLVGSVIEGKDVLTEGDLMDIVSEAAQIQRSSVGGASQEVKQLRRYPAGKPRYSKLITLPASMNTEEGEEEAAADAGERMRQTLVQEIALQGRNDGYDATLPAHSSVYPPIALRSSAFDFAYQPYGSQGGGGGGIGDFFDLQIFGRIRSAEDGEVGLAFSHTLRWASYSEYLLTLRALVRFQHDGRKAAMGAGARFTTKALYCEGAGDGVGGGWLPVTFTIDHQAELLVMKDATVDGYEEQSFEAFASFESVDGIIVKNAYHLSAHYMLEVRIHNATSVQLEANCWIDLDSKDGQMFTFTSDPKRVTASETGTSVGFEETHTVLLPPSAVLPSEGEERLRMTFHSPAIPKRKIPALCSSVDLPLSRLLPTMGGGMVESMVHMRSVSQEFEVRLRVKGITLSLREEISPYFVVYLADAEGNIISVSKQMASLDADRQQALQAAERQQAALGAERQIADREMQAAFQEGEAERDQVRAQSTTQSLTPEAPRRSSIMGLGAGLGGFARRDATPGSEPVGRHGIVGGTGKLMQGLVGGTVSGIMGGTNLVIQGTGMVVQGTGKVIQGTGNVVVQGTGKVIKGTGDVTMKVMRGTGDLTMKVVQGTGDLTMKVVQGTGDVAVNVLTLGNKQIVSTMNKADILYQSPVSKSLTWEEEVVLSTKTMGDAVQRAKFLLVEVWDKNTMADACLGECFLPIISAAQEPSEGEGGDGGASASSVGGQKYPLQISKHMKRSRAVGSASAALGSVTVQLTRKDLPTKMKDDLVAVNMVLQLKPIGALDFAWPCRLLTAGQAADALEDDQLHMQLGHTGLHIRTPLVQPYSDRALLLMECLERVPGDELELVVPYSQIIGGVCTILTTDALICGITLTRSVPSGTVKNTRVERPVTLDLLVGPCPAADVFTIIRQRTALHSICTTVKHLAGVTTSTTELNAVAKELAADIYATSRFIESLSAEIDTSALLENMGAGNVGTDSESTRLIQKVNSERSTSGAIFSDSHNRMSITYHRATLPLRVLTVRRALLRVYFWFLLEFSKTVAADVQNGEVRQNVDVQFNIGYVSILNHRARCTLKYGDPEHVNDGSDSDDDEYGGPGEKGEGPDTGSLVTRVVGIMEKLDQDARALLFQAYRKNLPRSEVEVLLNKMIYEQYIVIVSYLVDKLLDGDAREEDEEESEGSARGSVHGGEAHGVLPAHLSTKAQIQALIQAQALAQAQAALPTPPARGPLSPGLARFSSIASSVARGQVSQVARMATAVGDALQMQKMQAKLQALDKTDSKATRELAAQESHRKHDLISFVLSQDNLFVLYLNATLHAFDFTFRIPPYLSICLDFDLLIVRFSDNINENIQMWNSKALKVFMKGDERTSRVPWDVTTMDEATGNQLFISHIPESIQIQLNVQIGLKKIQTTGMGDNLSLLSIRRIQEINIKVARSIAKAYLALALEYETFLLDAIADTTTTPGKGDSSGGLSSLLNTGINLGARGVDMTVGLLGVRRAAVALQEHTAEEVDEFLCFLMSVVNDCTRLIAEHIPYTVSGFTKEFSEDEDALHAHTKKSSLGLTASEEIHSFYFNPIKAIKSVSRTATNILSNQVLFHGDLRTYFLRGFASHLAPDKEGSLVLSLVGLSLAKDTAEEEEDTATPIAVINATLKELYEYTASHVGAEDQKKIVYNCLQKITMRYLLMLRDLMIERRGLGNAINDGITTSITGLNTGISVVSRATIKVATLGLVDDQNISTGMSAVGRGVVAGGRGVVAVATLGMVGGAAEEEAPKTEDAPKEYNRAEEFDFEGELFSAEQNRLIRADLSHIMTAYLEVADEQVAELVPFLVFHVNNIISGATTDPADVDLALLEKFHAPPSYSPDLNAYDKILEEYVGMDARETPKKRGDKAYTLSFSDFSAVALKDYRVCVVRVTCAGVAIQSSILRADLVGAPEIRWKDVIQFQHVKHYQNKEVLVELVEIRPDGLRREVILARLRIQLDELDEWITPEAPAERARAQSQSRLKRATPQPQQPSAHVGWYVMDEVPVNLYSSRGIVHSIRGTTSGLLAATAKVGKEFIPLPGMRGTAEEGETKGRKAVSYISSLASDMPKESEKGPQIKVCIRVQEE